MITQEAVDYIREAVMYYMDSGLANTRYPEDVVHIVDVLQNMADREDVVNDFIDRLEEGDYE